MAQASVIGVAHPRWGETPCAVVVRRPGTQVTAEKIIAHCRERLAHYKCPTRVVFVEELPVTANGKVVKAELRKVVASADETSSETS